MPKGYPSQRPKYRVCVDPYAKESPVRTNLQKVRDRINARCEMLSIRTSLETLETAPGSRSNDKQIAELVRRHNRISTQVEIGETLVLCEPSESIVPVKSCVVTNDNCEKTNWCVS